MGIRISMSIVGLTAVLFLCGTVQAATLENPVPGAIKSGVGLISGWVCDADELEVSFDGGPRKFIPYGSERVDTRGVCGDTDNGFGLLWNYNELGDGPHTVTLYADGMVATQVTFNVKTLGTNFLRGVTGQGTITLSDGKEVNVQWEETTQGFTITGYQEGSTAPTHASDAALNRLRGTWRIYYSSPPDDPFDVWAFSRIETISSYRTLVGEFTNLDRIDWVHVALTKDVPVGQPVVNEYDYVALYEDVFEDEFGNTCEWLFFRLTSTTRFRAWAYSSVLFDDGTCGPIQGQGIPATGVRIRGPQ